MDLLHHSPVQTELAVDQTVIRNMVAYVGLVPVADLLVSVLEIKMAVLQSSPRPGSLWHQCSLYTYGTFRAVHMFPSALVHDTQCPGLGAPPRGSMVAERVPGSADLH